MAAGRNRGRWRKARAAALASAAALGMLAGVTGHAAAQVPVATGVAATAAVSIQPADAAVRAAVALIGDRFPSMPRIYVVDPATMHLKTTRAGFRLWYGDQVNPNVFVNATSRLYKDARAGDGCAVKSVAALLAHEIAHSATKDEAEPCRVEMTVLDSFIHDPSVGSREQICLMERRHAVEIYGRSGGRR